MLFRHFRLKGFKLLVHKFRILYSSFNFSSEFDRVTIYARSGKIIEKSFHQLVHSFFKTHSLTSPSLQVLALVPSP